MQDALLERGIVGLEEKRECCRGEEQMAGLSLLVGGSLNFH